MKILTPIWSALVSHVDFPFISSKDVVQRTDDLRMEFDVYDGKITKLKVIEPHIENLGSRYYSHYKEIFVHVPESEPFNIYFHIRFDDKEQYVAKMGIKDIKDATPEEIEESKKIELLLMLPSMLGVKNDYVTGMFLRSLGLYGSNSGYSLHQ